LHTTTLVLKHKQLRPMKKTQTSLRLTKTTVSFFKSVSTNGKTSVTMPTTIMINKN